MRPCSPRVRIFFAFVLAGILSSCGAPFKFVSPYHELPRIFVRHEPLHPQPNQPVTLVAEAEPLPGRLAKTITFSFMYVGASGWQESACSNLANNECRLVFPSTNMVTHAMYNASMEDDRGNVVATPTTYVFQVGEPTGKLIYPLRIPFHFQGKFNVVFIRDKQTYARDQDVWPDIDHFLHDQLLKDPGYRWRTDQFAFFYTPLAGITAGLKSGSRVRCGQDPWPWLNGVIPQELQFADSFGVLHQGDWEDDCAGLGVGQSTTNPKRNFSAHGKKPRVIQHEMGHALFGLGDEYFFGQEQREAPAGGPPDPLRCQCCPPQGSGGGGGTNGPAPSPIPVPNPGDPCDVGVFPPCDELPPECFPAGAACAPLQSTCVRPNNFLSETECRRAAAIIQQHPGVELKNQANPDHCRRLCGGLDNPCPCQSVPDPSLEVWILDDRHPPDPAHPNDPDIMGIYFNHDVINHNGPACERCMETALCVKWGSVKASNQQDVIRDCLRLSP